MSRLHGQQRALVVSIDVVVGCLDFVIQARDASNVLVGKD